MRDLSRVQEAGLRRGPGRLADDAHGPVLQLFKKQNRELSYASVRGSKPGTIRDLIGVWVLHGPGCENVFWVNENLSR